MYASVVTIPCQPYRGVKLHGILHGLYTRAIYIVNSVIKNISVDSSPIEVTMGQVGSGNKGQEDPTQYWVGSPSG